MKTSWLLVFGLLLLPTGLLGQEIPENAHQIETERGWECDDGYVERDGECIEQRFSDDEIRRILVRRSVASYSGSCACPYNRDSAGRRCGGRSAYSRPGGAEPMCYARDVPDAQVQRYRERNPPPGNF